MGKLRLERVKYCAKAHKAETSWSQDTNTGSGPRLRKKQKSQCSKPGNKHKPTVNMITERVTDSVPHFLHRGWS